ncbi:hypothetical protein OB920_01285 [Halobacteria archaeon HArc-gm2]|nr:hypothetical protein [Halobacteria archaeon HArc-gm2]
MFRGDDDAKGSSGESRAQTTLDFAIGISIFLAVVMFIFLFVPGIVEPFTVGAQDETVTVNRVADGLTQDQLGSSQRPGVLDTACTIDFFEHAEDGTDITACGPSKDDLADFVGIKDRQNVNVTVQGNTSAADVGSEQLCWDGSSDALVEADDGTCDVRLAAGETPPTTNADAVTATRVASLAGEDVTVVVEMW